METNLFVIPGMQQINFSIVHTTLDRNSAFNHHELHIHRECEIYINLSGDVVFEVENRIYSIQKGSVVLVRPYAHHHCIYRSNERHEHYWITVSMDESLLNMVLCEENSENHWILPSTVLDELCVILQKLLDKNGSLMNRQVCFWKLMQILRDAADVDSIQNTEVALSQPVRSALAFMEDHLNDDINIRQIADAASVSISTLYRCFKEELCASPVQVLRRNRLIASRKYLMLGLPVSEAAQRSGFNDYSNYIQLFRKQFGMTPMQYKRSQD